MREILRKWMFGDSCHSYGKRLVRGARHHLVELDDADRALIVKLDGRRKCESRRVEWFARMGLLEA